MKFKTYHETRTTSNLQTNKRSITPLPMMAIQGYKQKKVVPFVVQSMF